MSYTLKLPVGDLLGKYEGSRKVLLIQEKIPENAFDDVVFLDEIEAEIELIHVSFGIQVIIRKMEGTIRLPERTRREKFSVHNIEREFHKERPSGELDDIGFIRPQDHTIDLAPVIREEALLEALSL